jgi:hypothetical protein
MRIIDHRDERFRETRTNTRERPKESDLFPVGRNGVEFDLDSSNCSCDGVELIELDGEFDSPEFLLCGVTAGNGHRPETIDRLRGPPETAARKTDAVCEQQCGCGS